MFCNQLNVLQKVVCVRDKCAGITQNEVLGYLACMIGKHLSLDSNDLDGNTARGGDVIGQYVARIGQKRMTAP